MQRRSTARRCRHKRPRAGCSPDALPQVSTPPTTIGSKPATARSRVGLSALQAFFSSEPSSCCALALGDACPVSAHGTMPLSHIYLYGSPSGYAFRLLGERMSEVIVRCTVCDSNRLSRSEYVAGHVKAPALQCQSCGALQLHESAANSTSEQKAVLQALSAREAMLGVWEPSSGTRRISPFLAVNEIEDLCSEIDLAVARVCHHLESLGGTPNADGTNEVAAARGELHWVRDRVQDLARRLGRRYSSALAQEENTSDRSEDPTHRSIPIGRTAGE